MGPQKQPILFAVPTICEPIACQPVSFCQSNFSHLTGIKLADSSDSRESMKVDFLIGADQYWDLVTGEGIAGPFAIHTRFGWVLSGPTTSSLPDALTACLVTHTLPVDGQPQSFGIVEERECSLQEDFATSIHFVDGRYEVQLPLEEEPTRCCLTITSYR